MAVDAEVNTGLVKRIWIKVSIWWAAPAVLKSCGWAMRSPRMDDWVKSLANIGTQWIYDQ
ncbi:hypothetical protein SERLADRAFT_377053 [Serpula lacrymans var. lacrymans S7.9]|uniref:Uncharacterized protein n=1 Tax=Serpula lacrymans var. lacrymans (strain S7.9) TaxID=578457 RepID=F8NFD9_SERL9|nr:uncharacterized protein SERLADRAFT_377053 [Serpula lacrymans var. lacrymans S7.9]EGO31221.1 hypothetical protein SERLADRAFT_377053 [Serpula lacrymans var. lacrymans S7.9]